MLYEYTIENCGRHKFYLVLQFLDEAFQSFKVSSLVVQTVEIENDAIPAEREVLPDVCTRVKRMQEWLQAINVIVL